MPWAYAWRVELSFTRPAKPVDNCFVESFHDKFRDECLSTHWFRDLPEAQRLIEAWQEDYNTVRPHQGLGNRHPRSLLGYWTRTPSSSRLLTTQPN